MFYQIRVAVFLLTQNATTGVGPTGRVPDSRDLLPGRRLRDVRFHVLLGYVIQSMLELFVKQAHFPDDAVTL
ncbi:hypothetical protein MAR_007235, partial [Mya arenaria]